MVSFLEWMLESSLLVLMVLGIRKFFMGKVHYAAIYSLWIVVLLRFMIPVNFISTPVSVANLFGGTFSAWDHTEAGMGNVRSDESSKAAGDEIVSVTLASRQSASQASDPEDISDNGRIRTDADSSRVSSETGNGRQIFSLLSSLAQWYPAWQYGRIAVTALLLLWFMASNAALLRTIRAERRFYGQKGKLKIYTVSSLQTPCLYGFLAPAIYLPEPLLTQGCVSEEELEQMITHEYIHYCHRDHLWAMLRMLVVSIHWYHPFVWIASSYSKKDAELFCDEAVIHQLGEENRFRYGRMLVRLAGKGRWGDFRYSMMLMSRRGREMEGRIRAISGKRRYSKWMLLPLGAALASAMVVTCSSGIGPLTVQEPVSQVKASEPEQSSEDAGTELSFSQYADNYEEAFDRYIQAFTDAVNTGDIQNLDQVLLEGSDVCQQQCAIVQNYHKRGIREEIENYSISSAIRRTADLVSIDSDEEILVHYSDNTSKLVRQKYRYTCEYIDQGWIITDMQEIK